MDLMADSQALRLKLDSKFLHADDVSTIDDKNDEHEDRTWASFVVRSGNIAEQLALSTSSLLTVDVHSIQGEL